jgi:pimeloyl-ACP methyl ester carboxylesterase
MLADPVILVPGITATSLRDEYQLPPEIVWSVLHRHYDSVILHPNDLRYEAYEPKVVRPDQVFEIAYRELIEELRAELSPDGAGEHEGVPVYPFAYDWRKPLSQLADSLGHFVDEVIDRTRLQKHYRDAGYSGKVNLIGHSMGGLVIAGYLAGGRSRVDNVNRVATLATPFQGSYEAVLKITTGLGILDADPPKARDRHAARLTPSLYHLLPSFPDALDAPAGHPATFFNPGAWQPSVERTLARFIERTAVNDVSARSLFRRLLDSAENYLRRSVHELDLAGNGFDPDRWLCVVGVDSETYVQLSARMKDGELRYNLTDDNRMNQWGDLARPPNNRVADPTLTGDGTVPYRGAIPPFLDRSKLVCVTPSDYGAWELKDKTLTAVGGFHGILPNMNMIQRMLTVFFKPTENGGPPIAPNYIWGRPAPDLPNRTEAWNPPFSGGLRNKERG